MLLTKDNMLPQITLKPELPAAHVALVYDELGVCCWLNHVLFNLLTKGIVWHGSLADAIAPPLRPLRSVRHPESELLLLPLSLGATCCLDWPLKLLRLRCWLRLLPLRRWLHRRRHCRRASIAIVVGCGTMTILVCVPQEERPLQR